MGEDSDGGIEEGPQLSHRLRPPDEERRRVLQARQGAGRRGHAQGVPPWVLDHSN